jgi:REP element-mobilizing transposase RayT
MLEEGKYYHIYNRGNNSQPIFFENENYRYFLQLIKKYLEPVADIYSYCLIKNHYHLLIRVKPVNEINAEKLTYTTKDKPKKVSVTLQLSHLFNAYTQAINKRFNRTGSLFEPKFHRIEIDTDEYLIQSILYIHNNPVKHNVCKQAKDYFWSSYNPILSNTNENKDFGHVLYLFGGRENFIIAHNE